VNVLLSVLQDTECYNTQLIQTLVKAINSTIIVIIIGAILSYKMVTNYF